jgi:hypothetical protein
MKLIIALIKFVSNYFTMAFQPGFFDVDNRIEKIKEYILRKGQNSESFSLRNSLIYPLRSITAPCYGLLTILILIFSVMSLKNIFGKEKITAKEAARLMIMF